MIFSRSMAGAARRDRSESITHGGFDNDIATMTSVMRRVLDVPETAAVVDYFEAVPGFNRAAVARPRPMRRPLHHAPDHPSGPPVRRRSGP